MPQGGRVVVTANFERNLSEVRDFLAAADASPAFDKLVDELSDRVIPTLQGFPEIGAEFTARAPLSADGQVLFERAVRLAGPGGSLRQLIDGDFIILYLLRRRTVFLLAIRHQRQLSFDFRGHWP
jgi:plasmid stabilization system protein ParE